MQKATSPAKGNQRIPACKHVKAGVVKRGNGKKAGMAKCLKRIKVAHERKPQADRADGFERKGDAQNDRRQLLQIEIVGSDFGRRQTGTAFSDPFCRQRLRMSKMPSRTTPIPPIWIRIARTNRPNKLKVCPGTTTVRPVTHTALVASNSASRKFSCFPGISEMGSMEKDGADQNDQTKAAGQKSGLGSSG